MCSDLGSKPWRPHILHKALRHFFRSCDVRLPNIYSTEVGKSRLKSVESPEIKEWGSTSSTMSTNDWASSLHRRLTISVSSRSEKISVIREMRSFVLRGRSTKRFHAGPLLRVRKWSGKQTRGSGAETYKSRRICDTCGRRRTS